MENIKVGDRVIIHAHTLSDSHDKNGQHGTVAFVWHHAYVTDNVARVTLDDGGTTDVKTRELEIEQDDESRTGAWTDDVIASMESAYEAGAFRDHMSA